MPRGTVITVSPITKKNEKEKKCTGIVRALDSDPTMGIVKDEEYPFSEGKKKCCIANSIVTIKKKEKDGSVKLDCD
ncbi:hypothetical protein ACD591_14065 [Rufibacter glacialis]|uniref:Uncharacterized protein n=1 Tax=Rufibacter glacialis TaxID=1259555 RepID=A0A5M8Q5B5_9BACT|nr:hypothetical protein [Rufibacter glacialis]KAA6431029.1 hypothetical protein FOE74_18160 [Rufibacter glacialis]GGK83424.1 hypothetical protein GCM10011405_34120 [Rufibacter glacialis]